MASCLHVRWMSHKKATHRPPESMIVARDARIRTTDVVARFGLLTKHGCNLATEK